MLIIQYGGESMQIKLEGRNMDIQFYGLSDLLEVVDLIAAAGRATGTFSSN